MCFMQSMAGCQVDSCNSIKQKYDGCKDLKSVARSFIVLREAGE